MTLSELWVAHSQAQFPTGYGGKDVNGTCVTLLDSDVSGCISSYMRHNRTSIDIDRYLILQKSKIKLEEVLPFIEGEAFEYFRVLHKMCSIIINEASIA